MRQVKLTLDMDPVIRLIGPCGCNCSPSRFEVLLRDQYKAEPTLAPVMITLTFIKPKPTYRYDNIDHPINKPDVNKLAEAACRAMNGVLYHNSCQIIGLTAMKMFASDKQPPCIQIDAVLLGE